MDFDTIYYHANCTDGVTAAALLAGTTQRFRAAAIPCTYGKTVPQPKDYEDKVVAVVDFCFDQTTMLALAYGAEKLVVLDHHKSAQDLVLSLPEKFEDMIAVFGDNAKCESGAMLAWQFQNPGEPAPFAVRKVAERDTWNFGEDREECERFCAGLYHTMQAQGALTAATYLLEGAAAWGYLSTKGQVVREVARSQVQRSLEHAEESRILHRNCVLLNEKFNVSELGEAALREYPNADYAFMWFDCGNGQARISLRSRPGSNADCAAFAQDLGLHFGGKGGGHKHAAGCGVDLDALMNYWY